MRRFCHLILAGKTLLDFAVLTTAFCVAFLLRFEGNLPERAVKALAAYLPCVVIGKLMLLTFGGRQRLTWRYTSLRDALLILNWLAAATLGMLFWRLATEWRLFGIENPFGASLPLGVILLDLALSFLGLSAVRVAVRLWCETHERRDAIRKRPRCVRTLLVGAGRAGAMVAKEIAARPDTGIHAVGFLDDDDALLGMEVSGVSVLGNISQLESIARKHHVKQVLITIPGGPGETIRRITQACEACGLATKIIPSLSELMEGRINLSRIREVAIEDLLRRSPVMLDNVKISELVQNQTVMVTGAGGSIGSELCRIIATLKPRTLILVERAENSLFHVHRGLLESKPELDVVPCIADICDRKRMESIFSEYRPSLLLHAAAHKHVPMMEWNPCEAVKNNIQGTRTLASMADDWGVERFVMISTDKAVNPTSVMGVSKRIAELLIQSYAEFACTRFMTVRFGNVLGSAGSVVPIFQQQIARGGPVTVTHPEMKRYFMTIPEACQLVLQAASMGKGGEIFILDMGEPVKIVDIARDLIRLSGLAPDRDIKIHFTGIRPGEKLFEELFLGEENAMKTRHPRIFIGQHQTIDWRLLDRQLNELCRLIDNPDRSRILDKFKQIVPEYAYQHVRQDAKAEPPLQPGHSERLVIHQATNGPMAFADQ